MKLFELMDVMSDKQDVRMYHKKRLIYRGYKKDIPEDYDHWEIKIVYSGDFAVFCIEVED